MKAQSIPPSGGMLGKGLLALSLLGEHPDGATLSRLATELGFPLSTAHRLLNAMVPAGFVHFDDERRTYSLGLAIFQLSHRVSLVRTLSELALPAMRTLTEISGEQTLMAVRQGHDLVYLEKVHGHHQIQNHAEVGQRGTLHSSSMGKALMAFLPEAEQAQLVAGLSLVRVGPNTITRRRALLAELRLTRERGFAVNEEENEAGIRSVAVPVVGARQRPVCAICITAPTFRCSRETLAGYVPRMRELVREIEVRLPRGGAPANGVGLQEPEGRSRRSTADGGQKGGTV